MDASLTMRLRTEIEQWRQAQLADRATISSQDGTDDAVRFIDAEVGALGWVLGETDTAPLSGETGVDVTDPEMVDRERRPASRMLQREEPMDPRGRSYVSGVETALMWVVGLSNTPL